LGELAVAPETGGFRNEIATLRALRGGRNVVAATAEELVRARHVGLSTAVGTDGTIVHVGSIGHAIVVTRTGAVFRLNVNPQFGNSLAPVFAGGRMARPGQPFTLLDLLANVP
jgi:hypothetical protein